MTTSVNGWPLVPSGSPQLSTLPGVPTAPVALTGPVATLLGYVAAQFHSQVEAITSTSSHRPGARISGTSLYSNHASATAIDLNGQLHPQYRRGTFTATQVAKIRTILATTSVIDWGGDWNDAAVDEMHFEIRPGTTTQQAADAADALTREETDMTPDQASKLNFIFNALAPGEAGVRTAGHVLVQLGRIEAEANAAKENTKPITRGGVQVSLRQEIANIGTAVTGLPAAVWGYSNAKLETADVYSILRKIRDAVVGK